MTTSRRTRKAASVLGAAVLLALAFAASAQAHSGSATVSCTGADFRFSSFEAGSNTVHYVVTVDHAPVAQADFVLNEAGGEAGSLHVPLTISGTHTVEANAWWGPAGTAGGQTRPAGSPPLASQVVTCPAQAPAGAPAPPAAPPPPAVAPAQQAPASGVAGHRETSPARAARLSTASVCSSRRVRVSVFGRSMREVAVSLNGRRVRTVQVRPGQRSVRVMVPMRRRAASQVVSARVRFRNGAHARTLSKVARSCSAVTVQPQFTG
jgi:hypothetical protein